MRNHVNTATPGTFAVMLVGLVVLLATGTAADPLERPCLDFGAQPKIVAQKDGLGLLTQVVVAGDLAYGLVSGSGIAVIDWSDPADPVVVNNVAVVPGLVELALGAGALYCIDSVGQLRTFDLTDPQLPFEAGSLTPVAPASGLCLDQDRAYLVLESGGLQSVDLTVPLAPQAGGSVTLDGGNRGVACHDGLAYVAGHGFYNTDYSAFFVVDVSDLQSPVVLGDYFTDGDGWGWGSYFDDVIAGSDGVFVVQYDYWYDWDAEYTYRDRYFRGMDISDPADPEPTAPIVGALESMVGLVHQGYIVAALHETGPQDPWCPDCDWDRKQLVLKRPGDQHLDPPQAALSLPGVAQDICSAGSHLLLACGNAGLVIVDAAVLEPSADPALDPNLVPAANVTGEGAAVSGDLMAVVWHHEGGCNPGDESVGYMNLYDLGGGGAPVSVGSWAQLYSELSPELVFVGTHHIYAGSSILSYASLPNIQFVGTISSGPWRSVVFGDHLVGMRGSEIKTWDVTDPEAPLLIDDLALGGVNDLAAGEHYVYAAVGGFIAVVDVAPDGNMSVVDWRSVAAEPAALAVAAGWLVAGCPTGEIYVFDLDNPATPALLGELDLNRSVVDVALGAKIYAALDDEGWAVVEAGDGSELILEGYVAGYTGTQVHVTDDALVLVQDCPLETSVMGQGCPVGSTSATLDPQTPLSTARQLRVDAVWPNPANPRVAVSFQLAAAGHLTAEIMDLAGRRVAALVDAEYSAGEHELFWQGDDGTGRPVATGIYLVRLQFENESVMRKVTLVR